MKTTLLALALFTVTMIGGCTTTGTNGNVPSSDSLSKDSTAVDTTVSVGAIKSVSVDTTKVDSLKK